MKSYEFILYESITKHYITTTALNTYRYSPKTILRGINDAVTEGHLKEVDIVIHDGHNPLKKTLYHITEAGLDYFTKFCKEIVPWADLISLPKNKLYFTEYKKDQELIAGNYIRGVYPAIMLDAIGGNEIICSSDDIGEYSRVPSSVTELGKALMINSEQMTANLPPSESIVSPESIAPNCVEPYSPEITAADIVEPRSPEITAADFVELRSPESTAAECVKSCPTESTAADFVELRSPESTAAECVKSCSPESTAADSVEKNNEEQPQYGKQRNARLAEIILAAKSRYEYAIANSPELTDPITSSRSNINYAHSLQIKRIVEERMPETTVSKSRYDVRGGTFSGIIWTPKEAYLTYTALPGLLSTIFPKAFDRDEYAAMSWITQIQNIGFARPSLQAIQFVASEYILKKIWDELFASRKKAAAERTKSQIFSLKNFWIVPISQEGTSELASILHGQDTDPAELSARLTAGPEYRLNDEWRSSEFPFIDQIDDYCAPLLHLEVKQLVRIMQLSKQNPDKSFCLLYSSPWQSRYLETLFDLENYGNVCFTSISNYLDSKPSAAKPSMLQIEREGIIARDCLGLD